MSRLTCILIAESPRSPMVHRDTARLVPGCGVVGDRYHEGVGTFSPHPQKPDFEVTLIESEKVAAFALQTGLPFTVEMARRNLVTEGVDLNVLVGMEFVVGEVRLLGMRLCEPCSHLARTTFPEVLPGLVHRGGLRARILSEGTIRVGDDIRTGAGNGKSGDINPSSVSCIPKLLAIHGSNAAKAGGSAGGSATFGCTASGTVQSGPTGPTGRKITEPG